MGIVGATAAVVVAAAMAGPATAAVATAAAAAAAAVISVGGLRFIRAIAHRALLQELLPGPRSDRSSRGRAGPRWPASAPRRRTSACGCRRPRLFLPDAVRPARPRSPARADLPRLSLAASPMPSIWIRSPSSVMSSTASGSCTQTFGPRSVPPSCGARATKSSPGANSSPASPAPLSPRRPARSPGEAAAPNRLCQSRTSTKTCSMSSAENWNSDTARSSLPAWTSGPEAPAKPSAVGASGSASSSGSVSVSCGRASNALPQRPQRTVPRAISQRGGRHAKTRQALRTLGIHQSSVCSRPIACARRQPEQSPAVACAGQADIKPRSVRGCHGICLLQQQSAERDASTRPGAGGQHRGQFDQRSGEDIGQHNLCPRAVDGPVVGDPQSIQHGVAAGVLARGQQRLRVDVHGCRAARPQPQRRDREDARATAIVDHVRVRQPGVCARVQPFEAECRGGVRAGSERQSRVELQQHEVAGSAVRGHVRALAARTYPQPPAEAHRMEVLQPLALPGTVGDGLELRPLADQRGVERRYREQRRADCVLVGLCRKHGTHDDGRPQWHRPGRRFEHRVVGCIEQRDRQRAQLEQRVLVRLGVARPDVERELQERHPGT